jgi:putative redox protein
MTPVPVEEKMEPIRISATLAAGQNRRIIAKARGHVVEMDVRKERGGDDAGPTPPECLAMALGGCVMNLTRMIARDSGIRLEDVNMAISGDIDPSIAFGLDGNARAGFSDLSIAMELTPGLSDNDRERLRREITRRCPLCDTISNPTPLRISLK